MIILGLGSNLGDRLENLRRAFQLIKKIPTTTITCVSPVYISDALLPENAPVTWDTPYLNLALRCETQLTPYEFLHHTKQIEIAVGRKPEKNWGPRIIDIDLLAWNDLIQYDEKLHIPHENLHERPFALWPLTDVAPRWIYPLPGSYQGKTAAEISLQWGSRFEGNAPFHTKQIAQRIDTPQLVGILNITPDSFSDGGKFLTPAAAIEQVHHLVQAGAEIIDIGAESTRPGSEFISSEKEWQRLEPILKQLKKENFLISPKLSIDTRHVDTAEKALDLGIDWLNDVSGLQNPAMQHLALNKNCDTVLMHNLKIPDGQDPVSVVYEWGKQQIKNLDMPHSKIIFDIGIGYGKTAAQSLELIKHIAIFKQLGVRLLVGHSRKSFLTLFTNKPASERDIETTAISLFLMHQEVDYLRVHNIEMHARAIKTAVMLY